MKKQNTIAVMGIGNRGFIYADLAYKSGKVKISAVCDTNKNSLDKASDALDVPKNMRFSSVDDFFAAGRLADVLIIATPDAAHYENCMGALKAGYDIVLEKPVAVTERECDDILALAEKLERKVVVCHVLRYTDFYNRIKTIVDSGRIGKIIHFSQSENVGWWHYTQSFVRGKWKNSETSSPMILAKCCHDFDVINWIVGDKCVSLSSFGELTYFRPENAPAGSTENCYDCPARETCLYNAVSRSKEMPGTMNVPYGFGYTDEEIEEYLKDGSNGYGVCVYKSDNNVVDHQTVIMKYAGGATATLNMHAFAQSTYRHTKITGTKGEIDSIFSDEGESYIQISVNEPIDKFSVERIEVPRGVTAHGGGDSGFVKSIIDYFFKGKQNPDITSLEVSLASHTMALKAEESRLEGGKSKSFA